VQVAAQAEAQSTVKRVKELAKELSEVADSALLALLNNNSTELSRELFDLERGTATIVLELSAIATKELPQEVLRRAENAKILARSVRDLLLASYYLEKGELSEALEVLSKYLKVRLNDTGELVIEISIVTVCSDFAKIKATNKGEVRGKVVAKAEDLREAAVRALAKASAELFIVWANIKD